VLEDAGLALQPAVVGLGDVLRTRSEDVEDEAAVRQQQLVHRAEHAAPLLVGVHVQHRAEGTDHEWHPLGDRGLAQVADAQVDLDAGERGAARAHVEHSPRGVDPDHPDPVRRDRDGNAPRADAELEDRPARAARLLHVKGNVLDDARAPRVVQLGNRVVRARHDSSFVAVVKLRQVLAP